MSSRSSLATHWVWGQPGLVCPKQRKHILHVIYIFKLPSSKRAALQPQQANLNEPFCLAHPQTWVMHRAEAYSLTDQRIPRVCICQPENSRDSDALLHGPLALLEERGSASYIINIPELSIWYQRMCRWGEMLRNNSHELQQNNPNILLSKVYPNIHAKTIWSSNP